MPNVEKPTFVTGTGRCGSTIFHQVMAQHPQTAWLSPYCERHPNKPHLNRRAMQQLRCRKRLDLVPRATHLFEEAGALEEVARLAGDWFEEYLLPATASAGEGLEYA